MSTHCILLTSDSTNTMSGELVCDVVDVGKAGRRDSEDECLRRAGVICKKGERRIVVWDE